MIEKVRKQDFITILNNAIVNKKPFALYKLPKKNTVNLIVQNSDELIKISKKGFVINSFDNKKRAIIKSDIHIKSKIFEFDNTIKKLETDSFSKNTIPNTSESNFIKLIQKSLKQIQENKFDKVVVSRTKTTDYTINPIQSFFKLSIIFTNEFVNIWHHPKLGLWLGATPEKLLYLNKTKLSTVSLAGTTNDNIWSKKEITEQKIVTNYISKKLQILCRNIKISKTKSIKHKNIYHLKTKISAKTNHNYNQISKILHPTPAVCGVPKGKTFDFIIKNESYNREFYSGYIGIISNKKAKLFVNLRCAQIFNNQITAYSGVGITKKSVPQREWLETKLKLKSILETIKK